MNPKYIEHLSIKDKKEQMKMLQKSQTNYTKGKYITRKKLPSFTSKPSKHVLKAMKLYDIQKMPSTSLEFKDLSQKSGCSIKALKDIIKKGEGAYYSSGSRPNQTAQSWGLARLASAITGGKASKVDYHIVKTCDPTKKAFQLAKKW
jgi:beta-N-acetylglucosaminidase